MSDTVQINVSVNGVERRICAAARTTLADTLRTHLGLTGTHLGCEQGVCGSCTVLLDGRPVRSCLMFAYQVDGHEVVTVEGLSDGDDLHPLQHAFLQGRAFQCGFCTPGLLVAIEGVTEPLTPSQLREYLSAHICRCTGYEPIVAVAARRLAERGLLLEENAS